MEAVVAGCDPWMGCWWWLDVEGQLDVGWSGRSSVQQQGSVPRVLVTVVAAARLLRWLWMVVVNGRNAVVAAAAQLKAMVAGG